MRSLDIEQVALRGHFLLVPARRLFPQCSHGDRAVLAVGDRDRRAGACRSLTPGAARSPPRRFSSSHCWWSVCRGHGHSSSRVTTAPTDKSEPGTRKGAVSPNGRLGRAVLAVAALAALFHLFGAGFSPFTALVQRPVHLALMGTLAFLGVGVRALPRTKWGWGFNAVFGSLLVLCALYLVSQNEALVARSGSPTTVDLVAGAVIVVGVLVLAQRATGWGLGGGRDGCPVLRARRTVAAGNPGPSGVWPRPPHRTAVPVDGGDLGRPARRVGRLRLPLCALRGLSRRRGWRRTPHRPRRPGGGTHPGRPRKDSRGGERIHGIAVRQRRRQRGDHGNLHDPSHAAVRLPPLLCRRHRSGREHGGAAHATRHGGGRIHPRDVDQHPLRQRGSRGGDPRRALLRGPALGHPLPGVQGRAPRLADHADRRHPGAHPPPSPGADHRHDARDGALAHAGRVLGCRHLPGWRRTRCGTPVPAWPTSPAPCAPGPRERSRWPRPVRRRGSWSGWRR